MATHRTKRPVVAALLSALIPGLGQFYNHHWLKGGGFLAGAVVLSELARQQISMQALLAGDTSGVGRLLGLLVVLLGFVIWSMADAYRSARTHGT